MQTEATNKDISPEVKNTESAAETKKDEPNKCGKDEKRMELNRIRAKKIRKRKKEMEEQMQQQVVKLTLENHKLRTQLQVQEAEIHLLRNSQNSRTFMGNQQGLQNSMGRQQSSFFPSMSYSKSQFGGTNGLPTNLDPQMQSNGTHSDPTLMAGLASPFAQSGIRGLPIGTQAGFMNGINDNLFKNNTTTPNDMSMRNLNGLGSSSQPLNLANDKQDDYEQQTLATLLKESTSQVKQSILDKLQQEHGGS